MRRFAALTLSAALLLAAVSCSKQERYAKDSRPYAFFRQLSEIVPALNPEETHTLVKTSKFKVTTADVMPVLYRYMSGMEANLSRIPREQLMAFVTKRFAEEGEKRLLFRAARDAGVTVPADSIEAMMEKVFKNTGGKEAFTNQLVSEGWTFDRFREDVEINMTLQRYLENQVYQGIAVSAEEIRAAHGEERYATVRHILLVTQGQSDSSKAALRAKLEGILARARKGEDFAKLARLYSEDPGSKTHGGLYENFKRGDMVQPFDGLAFSLAPGKLSDVFETAYGYHIMKVISRSAEKRPLETARPDLLRELMGRKRQAAREELMKTLKLKYEYKELWNTV
jgi:parvulin-like peptidyl-prolyl isomerase